MSTTSERDERHAEYDAWKLSMAGKLLPSESAGDFQTLHADDLHAVKPTADQRADALARNTPGHCTSGNFDARQVVLSKIYVRFDADAAQQRTLDDLKARIRASAEYREPPEKPTKKRGVYFEPPVPPAEDDELNELNELAA